MCKSLLTDYLRRLWALLYHPHVHLLVTAGGLSADSAQWIAPNKANFLAPEGALAIIFRAKLCAALKQAGWLPQVPPQVWKKDWVVHCKAAGSGRKVLRRVYDMEVATPTEAEENRKLLYVPIRQTDVARPSGCRVETRLDTCAETSLGARSKTPCATRDTRLTPTSPLSCRAPRYVFRVAISNSRLERIQDGQVTFRYRDNHTQRLRRATLPAIEFIGPFRQHVLPPGCTKVRYYGLWINSRRRQLAPARALLDAPPRAVSDSLASPAQPAVSAPAPARCPHCRRGQLIVIQVLRAERKLPP